MTGFSGGPQMSPRKGDHRLSENKVITFLLSQYFRRPEGPSINHTVELVGDKRPPRSLDASLLVFAAKKDFDPIGFSRQNSFPLGLYASSFVSIPSSPSCDIPFLEGDSS